MAKLGEGERQVRLGQDRLAIKRKRAESIYIVLPAPHSSHHLIRCLCPQLSDIKLILACCSICMQIKQKIFLLKQKDAKCGEKFQKNLKIKISEFCLFYFLNVVVAVHAINRSI